MKNNKGITLIALVVTIIVLLILAGVSIAMLTGDNGILNRASESSYTNALGGAKDAVALKATELVTDYYREVYVNANNTISGDTANARLNTYVNSGLKTFDLADSAVGYNFTDATSSSKAKIKLTYNAEPSHYVEGTIDKGKITWGEIH